MTGRVFILTVAVFVGAAGLAAGQENPRTRPKSLTTEQVAELIRKLNADSFNVREAATMRLVDAGYGAIPLIAEAVSDNDLEVTTRLIRVLGELALSGDLVTEKAARDALTKIADTRVTSAATRAAETLATLSEVREDRCLEQLKKLGAQIEKHTYAFSNGAVDLSYSIEIDKRWKGNNTDAEMFRWVPHVRHLTLDSDAVNNDWITHVAQLTRLTDLTIARATINSEGLTPLKSLEQLETLQLMYVDVDDRSIETLDALKRVKYMRLYGTRLSRDGIQQLKKLRADATLDIRSGGFLGIGASPSQPQCVINDVHAGTAADRAGLASGDVILKYNGKDVTNFEGLTELIAENAPGDEATLLIQRGEEQMEKKVTLGEWKLDLE